MGVGLTGCSPKWKQRKRVTDRFEAETAEIPALTEADVKARMNRKTPVTGHSAISVPCTDPAYVVYLETQLRSAHAALHEARAEAEGAWLAAQLGSREALQAARDDADSAREVARAVAVHNADLTEQVRKLSEELAEIKISRE